MLLATFLGEPRKALCAGFRSRKFVGEPKPLAAVNALHKAPHQLPGYREAEG
jgi:hypothetical protein